jgi:hypothetical protein
VRGLREASDFNEEFKLHGVAGRIDPSAALWSVKPPRRASGARPVHARSSIRSRQADAVDDRITTTNDPGLIMNRATA